MCTAAVMGLVVLDSALNGECLSLVGFVFICEPMLAKVHAHSGRTERFECSF